MGQLKKLQKMLALEVCCPECGAYPGHACLRKRQPRGLHPYRAADPVKKKTPHARRVERALARSNPKPQ
jgi:hypothetical protein